MPVGVPVHFSITASSVMNAFFIPRLGGMIYAMPRMQTQLNLLASEQGTYDGLSANYSGDGFSDMTFKARALSSPGFDAWVESARRSEARLDAVTLRSLLEPGIERAPRRYSAVEGDVFHQMLSAEAQRRPGATRVASADRVRTTRGD
jgi:cytochrome o ubiquinol oxidase subunit 2